MKSQTTDRSSEEGIKRILTFSRGGKEENKFKWLLFILSISHETKLQVYYKDEIKR